MSGTRITIDGLWSCLCPSVDAAALLKSCNGHVVFRTRAYRPRLRPLPLPRCAQLRSFRCTNRRTNASDNKESAFTKYAYGRVKEGQGEDQSVTVKTLLRNEGLLANAGLPAKLHGAPTTVIYEALRALQGKSGQRNKIRALVVYLVESREEKPNAFLYEALIASNWDVAGSAGEVKELMNEMKTLGIAASPSLYHAALRALAVHPDYLQRNTILLTMSQSWIDVTPEGRCSVALGLLRDGQYELALDALEKMAKDEIAIPPWLYDIFTFSLGQLGHVDEAVKLLQQRLQTEGGDQKIPLNVWYFLLDECSRELFYEGTKFVWNQMAQSKTLVPSDGICLNVLNTASRHSDSKLATQAIQQLSARGVKLGMHHFEALVDCYSENNDLENALQVLCIMNNAGIHSDRASTRSIFLALKRSRSLAAVAVDALFSLRAKHEIPISAFNVVIEGLCETGASEKAIELYHDVRRLCSSVPNVHTFEPLFERCTELQTAEFLASEMSAFNIRPSRLIYDQLVYLFALDGDIETAFRHLWEMGRIAATTGVGKTAESWVTRRTAVALLKRCVAIKDERAWDLFDAAKRRGMDLAREIDSPITAPMVNAGDKPSLSVETPPPRAEIDVSPVSTAVAYRA